MGSSLLFLWREIRTERDGGISTAAALAALFGEASLVCPFALESLGGAFIELSLERPFFLLEGSGGPETSPLWSQWLEKLPSA